jgi:hypothetical protein
MQRAAASSKSRRRIASVSAEHSNDNQNFHVVDSGNNEGQYDQSVVDSQMSFHDALIVSFA